MQKATLNQCFEVSLSVCYLQYIVLQYRMMHIMLQSVFDKTVTCSFFPFLQITVHQGIILLPFPSLFLDFVWYGTTHLLIGKLYCCYSTCIY